MEIPNSLIGEVDEIDQNLLDTFLEPYKENCRYLQSAKFIYPQSTSSDDHQQQLPMRDQGIWHATGNFCIPESCYIVDTGHFNAVEFNICYNQLFYIAIAYLIKNRLIEIMQDWDLEIYQQRQLSDFLIARYSATFKKTINAKNFRGNLAFKKYSTRRGLIILNTEIAFHDQHGGTAQGKVTICVPNH